ncbi:Cytochrome P450 [Dillenia turbinata]|uniref:Cytochrome P450 n=1 Tax=Dillenia turbinata TaxID=194707 RepID=A0AAN8W0U0_9MAGN
MECSCSSIFWLTAIALLLVLVLKKISHISTKSLPPGPPGWPVIGNMLDLGGVMPHQTLYKLQSKYGPVMWLQLGSVGTLVVQSAKAAADLFKNHDIAISDRKCPDAVKVHGYNQGAISVCRYGPYWHLVRRLYASELINKQIDGMASARRKCIDDMIWSIEEETEASRARGGLGEVVVSKSLFLMTFNLMGNFMFSKNLLGSDSREGHDFFDAMGNIMEWAGKPNVADFLPLLKWVDPQGLRRGATKDMARALMIVAGFMQERMNARCSEKEMIKRDFLDALLEYEGDEKEGPDKISNQNIKIIIMEALFGGTETTSSVIEWTLTELLRKPEIMRKAQAELDSVVGAKSKVEESDINKLPYLQAIIKESLRLHPSVPLLIPRNTLKGIDYLGYWIPKNTQVWVNAWAIGRDPEFWDDPLTFKPERFLDSSIDYKGQHFGLIPFGSGRRMCVGMSMANRVVSLAVASLLHYFHWELDGSIPPETIDMNERLGITLRKLVPLKAIPRRRRKDSTESLCGLRTV